MRKGVFYFLIFLIFLCILILGGCGNGSDTGPKNNPPSTPDLDNWQLRTPLPEGVLLYGITYGKELFVGVGRIPSGALHIRGDEGKIFTSRNGITWTERSSGTSSYLYGIDFVKGIFMIPEYTLTTIMSPDGITWTRRPSPSFFDFAYGDGIIVGVGGGIIATSTDGISWTPRSEFVFSLLDVAYGNGIFIAIGNDGHNNVIVTSPDGISWTKGPSNISPVFYDITYGNGNFVAVGKEGTIYITPDGMSWTPALSGTSNSLWAVTHGGNMFVVVGGDGTILTSSYGAIWTPRFSGTTEGLIGVTYGNGTFIAVGSSGIILQTATLE